MCTYTDLNLVYIGTMPANKMPNLYKLSEVGQIIILFALCRLSTAQILYGKYAAIFIYNTSLLNELNNHY